MHSLVYGTIENIVLIDGQPVLVPLPKLLRRRRLGGRNQEARPCSGNYLLKRQVLELFKEFECIGSGVITRIDVKDGLPYNVELLDNSRP